MPPRAGAGYPKKTQGMQSSTREALGGSEEQVHPDELDPGQEAQAEGLAMTRGISHSAQLGLGSLKGT